MNLLPFVKNKSIIINYLVHSSMNLMKNPHFLNYFLKPWYRTEWTKIVIVVDSGILNIKAILPAFTRTVHFQRFLRFSTITFEILL
jgi:hypothetical protein